MKNLATLKKGQRVAYLKNLRMAEYKTGEVISKEPNYEGLVLVKFDESYSRWVSVKNLFVVTKSK